MSTSVQRSELPRDSRGLPDPVLPSQPFGGIRARNMRDSRDAAATIRGMDFDTLKSIIEAHRDELRELGVRRVRVFGSVARGEATASSDVDLIVDTAAGTSLFGWGDIHNHLSDWLGLKVDIVEPESVRGRMASEVWSDVRDVAQID